MRINKNNNSFILYILTIFVLGSVSCSKDWFDVKSEKELTIPSSLRDFEYLLDNYLVMSNNSPGLGEIACDDHYISENAWNTYLADNPSAIAQRNAYTWSNTQPYITIIDWNESYRKIFQCNLVLEGLSKIEINTENKTHYNSIKGNALFHRAKSYYDLAQIYAEPFQTHSQFGLPLIKTTDVTTKNKRSSVDESYQFIIMDLLEAASLLPIKPQLLTRGSKLSCWGLLARVSLLRGEYSKGILYCDSIINVMPGLQDFTQISTPGSPLGLFNQEVIFQSKLANYPFIFDPTTTFTPSFLYNEFDENDLRKLICFIETPDGVVFVGNNTDDLILFSGISLDEIYLIRSESLARLDKIQPALDDLNKLLESRWKKNPDGTSTFVPIVLTAVQETIRYILKERRKQLMKRGLRWSDLRRLNYETDFATTLTRSIGGKEYVLPPKSYKYTFPIPVDELNNSLFEQNPEWE